MTHNALEKGTRLNRKEFQGSSELNYCFVHGTERHIHVVMKWTGLTYEITKAIEEENGLHTIPCEMKFFPYRRKIKDIALIEDLLAIN